MPIPNYDLGMLMTLDIGLAILGLILTFSGIWAILYQTQRNTREIAEGMRDISREVREVGQIHREVAFMIRRQYGDIDRDVQEIKELLGGQ